MLFWFITTTRYLLVALAACVLSAAISLLTISSFVARDENPVVGGLLWLFAFLAEGSLLVPLSLAITGELVERKVQARGFEWPKAGRRFLLAIPMAIGPLCAAVFVAMRVEDRRPAHSLGTAVLLCCVSAVFAYLGLRIRKHPTPPI